MVAKSEHKHRTGCPVANALDIVGDHWTLLIIRNLMFLGAHEYKDMLAAEEKISSNILTNRLKKLEHDGLIASVAHPDSKRRKLYYLTAMGKDLMPLMIEMVLWANKHLQDQLDIPADKKAFLEKDSAGFAAMTLANLQEWEREFL